MCIELLMLSLLNSVGVPARLLTLVSPDQRFSGDKMFGVIPAGKKDYWLSIRGSFHL